MASRSFHLFCHNKRASLDYDDHKIAIRPGMHVSWSSSWSSFGERLFETNLDRNSIPVVSKTFTHWINL